MQPRVPRLWLSWGLCSFMSLAACGQGAPDGPTGTAGDDVAPVTADEGGGLADGGNGPSSNGNETSQDGGAVAPDETVDRSGKTYAGGWPVGACAEETLIGTGTKAGDIAHDFEQPDQFGDTFRLHDFCDRLILLVGSAYW